MASNKKAQILAAVMCASSIFGSYTVVSAADSISAGNINQTGAQVSTNENGKITATAKNDNGKSTITLQGNNFSVSVGGTATSSLALKDGTFTLNSKNLKIDSNGLNIYDGTNTSPTAKISKAGAITGTGLTIKNGTTTLASLNNSGLTVNGTSNINSTGTNANSGKSAKSTVSYSSGVQDTVTNDTLKGYTTTAQVLYSGVNNKVVDNNTNNILAQTSVGLVDRPQDNSKYGNIVLTANKYVVDTTEAVTKKVSTTILTLDGNTAKLEAGVGGSNNANVNLNSDKKGTVAITAGKVEDVQGNITLSGKNVNLGNNTFSLKNTTTGKDIAKIDSYGLNVNGTGTSSIKAENATTGVYVKNEISSAGMTTTARGGMYPGDDNDNKTESKITYTGVTDTVYDDGGNLKTKSSVTTSGITNTVYDVNTGKALANSSLTTSGISNTTTDLAMTGNNIGNKMTTALNQNSGGISASATKKYEDGTTTKTSLTLDGDSAKLYADTSRATVQVYNTTGNVDIKAGTVNGVQGNVTLSGKNVNLGNNTFSLKNTTTGKDIAKIDSYGLNVNGTGTSSIKAENATTGVYVKNEISSAGMTTTARGGMYPGDDNDNKTESKITYTGVTDTVYDDGGNLKTKSSVTTSGITNTVYDVNTGKALANSSLTTSGISNTTTDLAMTGTNEGKKMSTALYQNSNGISASATKKDENGTVGTSTLTLAGDSASLKVGNYGFAVDSNNNVSIAGNNATLSGSTFTLKDANGKTATLNTSGLTLKDEDGNTTGGISTTGAVTGTSLNITAKNTAGNKTTSTVGATGVTDAVYGTDGARVAYSNVGTGGISNTTSLKTTTGKIDTAINQNTSGVGITSTKYNDSNKTTETTSVSVNGGTSSITSNGSYVYGEDGKVTSYNQASMSLNGNTGTATIRGGSNTASSTLTLNEAGVALSGKNANLSGSTFTLKDTASGKSIATLGTNGLSLNKVNSDGTTINYGTWNSNGLNVNGTGTTTIKSTNATTGAMGQSQLSYNGVTDTVTNAAGNKTTSTVNATGVTDTVYNVKGNQVASSSVGTSGISNTTTALQMTGTNAGNTMSTGIYQNNGGISATATKKDVDGNTIGTSTLSLGGNSASLKVGNYGFAVDSSNNVSISGNNATLSGSTFTLKDVNTGKTAILNTNGLTLKDGDGTITGGISTTGAVTGTSLRITTSEDAGGNKTVSTVATNAVTDTVTNTKTNNKTTSQVSATGVRDTVYDANNKTVASSTVTTSGISNNTNISGIAIKDDKYNTKTMNTSIAQNANGVSISSTKYNVYNDGTNTVQTTDGTSSISVNGAKTTISGYGNYEYEKDENGKLVVSSRNSASLSVDGESGIISLSGKNVGLSANGLTLYKDVEGVKTQYASLTAGGLNVNGTGTTTIKSTNATTGDMGQSQLSYNGVTDTVTNAAGNKTTSTVNATGTIDQVYDTDGKTRIAYSNITTTGITDSFTKDGITNSVTTNANGTTFASTGNGSTTIKGGAITTNSITVAGNTIDGGFFDTIGQTNGNTAGIVRTEINGDWITSIEGALDISRSGNISLNADKLTYSYNDGKNSGTLGALANKVDDI